MDAIELIKQGKIKRFFRATKKLNAPGLIFHITQRATGKDPLFLEDRDYLFMLAVMKDLSRKRLLNLYAFCLMPNHVHLLFSSEEANLYDAMRDLFSRYAMRFNRKYERKGHLFGGPYRQAICLDDSYLLAASLYIHLNPVRAGLVADARRYRWSSCKLCCNNRAPGSFVNPSPVLDLLPGKGSERKAHYRILLKQGSEIKTSHVLEEEDAVDRFRARLAAVFPVLFKKVDQARRIAKSVGIDILGLEDLEKMIENLSSGHPSDRPTHRKAKKYLIDQLLARGFKRQEVAERLGISVKTVYNILKPSI